MNKEYWEKFYRDNKIISEPTEFAKFCLPYIPNNTLLLDIGCGNGRDTYFFAEKDNVIGAYGIDTAILNKHNEKVAFGQMSFTELDITCFNVVYSRFFLHSITYNEVFDIITKLQPDQLFMAEYRIVGDEPKLYPDHKRHLVDHDKLFNDLASAGFEILYQATGRDMAKYKTENPLVGRIIAKKR